MPSFRDGLDLS